MKLSKFKAVCLRAFVCFAAMTVMGGYAAAEEDAEFELKSLYNLGPALSKVYQVPEGSVSLGAYAELFYTNYSSPDSKDVADAYRFVPIIGYNYKDKIVANSELEIEHAMVGGNSAPGNVSGRGGYVAIEFLYLDFLMSKAFNLRVGSLLMPVGLINEIHEPPTFHGVMRPEVEREIIPTTWYDVGAGFHGSSGKLDYRAYVVNGLDVALFTDGSGGIKSMRQRGARASAENFAVVGRADYSLGGNALVGGSLYGGRADQTRIAGSEVNVTLAEAHASAVIGRFEIKSLVTGVTVGGADNLNVYKKIAAGSDKGMGSVQTGGYLECAVNVHDIVFGPSEEYTAVFARYEIYDTHAAVPSGWARNPSYERRAATFGLTYKPDPKVVVKADYTTRNSAAPSSAKPSDSFNLGVGFMF